MNIDIIKGCNEIPDNIKEHCEKFNSTSAFQVAEGADGLQRSIGTCDTVASQYHVFIQAGFVSRLNELLVGTVSLGGSDASSSIPTSRDGQVCTNSPATSPYLQTCRLKIVLNGICCCLHGGDVTVEAGLAARVQTVRLLCKLVTDASCESSYKQPLLQQGIIAALQTCCGGSSPSVLRASSADAVLHLMYKAGGCELDADMLDSPQAGGMVAAAAHALAWCLQQHVSKERKSWDNVHLAAARMQQLISLPCTGKSEGVAPLAVDALFSEGAMELQLKVRVEVGPAVALAMIAVPTTRVSLEHVVLCVEHESGYTIFHTVTVVSLFPALHLRVMCNCQS